MTSAVVLGGGMAGMLTASVLAQYVDTVTIVEGDSFPAHPAPRKGLPQGHHSHMFMAGGAQALDRLLPGTTERLYAAGANHRGMPAGMLTLSAVGWFPRHDGASYVVVCSRDLMDHVVRQQVLVDDSITVLTSATVAGLVGDAERVHGVRVRQSDGAERVLPADIVADATGRRSKAPDWLAELGAPRVEEEFVDSGLAYATRLYQAPDGVHEDFPAVLIQPQSGTGQPGRGATLFPIEGGRWIVTMTGTRGAEPPTDEDGFTEFARQMRHPVIAELMAATRPIGEIRPYRGTVNRRRFYERLPVPAGFVVVGDAFASLNPVYAHGMSAAALGALALRAELAKSGLGPGLSAAAQSAIADAVQTPWAMASEQDLGFPDVRTNKVVTAAPDKAAQEFGARMAQTALSEPAVANALFGIYTLTSTSDALAAPELVELIARGPSAAPLTADEAIAQFPEFGTLLARV